MKNFIVLARLFLFVSFVGGPCLARAAEPKKTNESSTAVPGKPKGYQDLNVEQFDKLRGDRKTVVLDVRTPGEFAAGHIPGATNINVRSPDFEKKVSELDKNQTYLVHCAAGVRSATACEKLSRLKLHKLL